MRDLTLVTLWCGRFVGRMYGRVTTKIGPLQVAVNVVQNRRTGEQKSHWDKTNKGNYHLIIMYAFCLSCPSATFAHQYGGFVPREWLPAKGLLLGWIDNQIFLATGLGSRAQSAISHLFSSQNCTITLVSLLFLTLTQDCLSCLLAH